MHWFKKEMLFEKPGVHDYSAFSPLVYHFGMQGSIHRTPTKTRTKNGLNISYCVNVRLLEHKLNHPIYFTCLLHKLKYC